MDKLANSLKKKILKRLYALDEEHEILAKEATQFWTEDQSEHFWGVDLDSGFFLISNQILDYLGGPRTVIGLVGFHKNKVMNHKKSVELFKKAWPRGYRLCE